MHIWGKCHAEVQRGLLEDLKEANCDDGCSSLQEKGSKVRNVLILVLVEEEDSGQEGGHHADADHRLLLLADILKLMEEGVDVKVGLPGIDKEDGNKRRGKIVDNTKEEVDRGSKDKKGKEEDNEDCHYQFSHASRPVTHCPGNSLSILEEGLT